FSSSFAPLREPLLLPLKRPRLIPYGLIVQVARRDESDRETPMTRTCRWVGLLLAVFGSVALIGCGKDSGAPALPEYPASDQLRVLQPGDTWEFDVEISIRRNADGATGQLTGSMTTVMASAHLGERPVLQSSSTTSYGNARSRSV